MIVWFYGNSEAGKTTAAKAYIKANGGILLDGDALRAVWPGLGFSQADRWEQNLRTARLAKLLADQGNDVVVAVIAPYRELREEIRTLCDCQFIYIPGGRIGPDYPFES